MGGHLFLVLVYILQLDLVGRNEEGGILTVTSMGQGRVVKYYSLKL